MQQDFFPEHQEVSRRYFLRRSLELGGGAACVGASGLNGDLLGDEGKPAAASQVTLDGLVKKLEFLTKPAAFGTVERGNPLPYKLPPEKLKTAGLTRESWRLEVLADPASNSQVTRPLRLADETALTFEGLMKMAEKHSVRFLKTMTCNNEDAPLGTGLWEGVPLRDVIWTANPKANIRRAWFYGYHNEDPKQEFRGSLSIGRILEDPPGVPPVILCYKLNGDWISGKRGGPVRMVIPECYGFKNIKWLTKVFLTNRFNANDTYAGGNND
ncbi:MAG: molybdopterin-dependent oxidoreductase, partial [Planctomycetota bacterium]|nr:molybdopterin-dependent oxidoreductase [Planctomycetota bacterium]